MNAVHVVNGSDVFTPRCMEIIAGLDSKSRKRLVYVRSVFEQIIGVPIQGVSNDVAVFVKVGALGVTDDNCVCFVLKQGCEAVLANKVGPQAL